MAVEPWITSEDILGCSALADADPADVTYAIQWASTFGWEVSGRTVGVIAQTRAFCPMSCNCGTDFCGCLPARSIDLGDCPVVDVSAVVDITWDGFRTLCPIELFRVLSRRYLGYINGSPWSPSPSVAEVTYRCGVEPDIFDMDAVAALACEKLKSIRRQPCALPDGMESYATGNGTRVKLIDPFDKRLMGLPPVVRFYEWALTKFRYASGGMLDPSVCASSYTQSWTGEAE